MAHFNNHLTLAALFRLQLIIAPLFLSRIYGTYMEPLTPIVGDHPYAALTWMVAVPMVYAFALSAITCRPSNASFVFSGIRKGIAYGLLFGTLAWGPIGIPKLVKAIVEFQSVIWIATANLGSLPIRILLGAAQETLAVPCLLCLFLVVYYSILGATAGAASGIWLSIWAPTHLALSHRRSASAG